MTFTQWYRHVGRNPGLDDSDHRMHVPRHASRRMRFVWGFVVCLAVFAYAPPATGAEVRKIYIVKFSTADGWFRARIEDPASVARIDQTLADGSVDIGIPTGIVVRGDGGVNRGHGWHIDDVELADATTEVCDATAAHVDEYLDDWITSPGRFCPWSARARWFVTKHIDAGRSS